MSMDSKQGACLATDQRLSCRLGDFTQASHTSVDTGPDLTEITDAKMKTLDIFRTFHPNAEEYTFFLSTHGTFSRTDHILGHKLNFNKFKKIEITSSIFSKHNVIRLDINYMEKKKKPVENTSMWRLNNTFLTNQQVTEEIKREIKEKF